MNRHEREEFARIEAALAGSDPEFAASVAHMPRPSLVPLRALRALLLSALLLGLTPLAIEAGVLVLAVGFIGGSVFAATRWLMLTRVALRSRPLVLFPDGPEAPASAVPLLFLQAVVFLGVASAALMLVVLLFS